MGPPPPDDARGAITPRRGSSASAWVVWHDEDAAESSLGPAGSRRTRTGREALTPRLGSYLLVSAAVFVLLLLVDGAYVKVRLTHSLEATGGYLGAAEQALTAGQVAAADRNLRAAADSLKPVRALTLHPSFVLGSWMPGIGPDIRSAAVLSDAAQLSTQAASHILTAVQHLGIPGPSLSAAVYQGGQVRFGPIEESRSLLSTAARLLGVVQSELILAPRGNISSIRNAVRLVSFRVASVAASVAHTQSLLSRLPSLLGKEANRRYLLAFQALGEARATGGVIGFYGILRARAGEVSLTRVGYLGDLVRGSLKTPVAAPAWFQRNYGGQFATRQWQQVNLSPSFPAVAKVLLNMYRAAAGRRLDGVIAMDPIALQDLLPATGPIKGPGLPRLITSSNAAQVLLHDSYVAFPNPNRQNRFLSGIVERFWRRVKMGHFDATTFVLDFAKAVGTQHVKIYSSDPQDEEALATVGANGAYTRYGPNVQMVFNNNYSANKVDFFLRRHMKTTVRLASSGEAQITTRVSLKNLAPSGPPSVLLGPGVRGDHAGVNRMTLNFLLPRRAHAKRLVVNGRKTFPIEYVDKGHPVVWDILTLPPGGTATATLSYSVPGAVEFSDSQGLFRFGLIPQPTIVPEQTRLVVRPPSGWRLDGRAGGDMSPQGTEADLTIALSRPTSLSFRLSPR